MVEVATGGVIPDGFTHAIDYTTSDLGPSPLMFVATTWYLYALPGTRLVTRQIVRDEDVHAVFDIAPPIPSFTYTV